MGLTTAQIKAQLDTIDWTGNGLPNIVVNTNLQPRGRQKFPRIDLENVSMSNTNEDVRVTSEEQRVIVHLYWRIVGMATDEEAKIGTSEILIAANLNNFIFGTERVRIQNLSWDRVTKDNDPVRHIVTSLTVLVEKFDPTNPDAVLGGDITITTPNITGIKILSKPTDRDNDTIEDIIDDTLILKRVATIKSKRSIFLEIESTDANLTEFRTLKQTRTGQSFTITRPSSSEVITAYIADISASASFEDIESFVVQLDVINP